MISSGFTLFLIGGLGGLKSKHESVCFTRKWEVCGGFLILIKYIYNQMLYLHELGFYVEVSLTVKYLTESILVQDGIESKFLITLLIHSTTFQ